LYLVYNHEIQQTPRWTDMDLFRTSKTIDD